MAINLNLKIEKRHLGLLAAIMVFLVGVTYVIAFNDGRPEVHGHDVNEIRNAGSGGGALNTYASDWFACTAGKNYVINHNLNSDKVIFQVFFSTSADGSNAVTQYAFHDHSHGDFSYSIGEMIKPTSLNSATMQAGASHAGYVFNDAGAGTWIVSGYCRVIAIKGVDGSSGS